MAEIYEPTLFDAAAARHARTTHAKQGTLAQARQSGRADALDQLDDTERYVTRFVQLGRPDLAARFAGARADGRGPGVSALEQIIEQNDLMGVAFLERGLAAARAVCRVVVRDGSGQRQGYGTGFMISPGLLMTNNHVLTSPSVAANSLVEFDYALGPTGMDLPVVRFGLDPARFFETHPSNGLDFTIVAVASYNEDGNRVADRGWIHLIPESGKAIVGEPLNIIQHPGGERMQIAIRENTVLGPSGDFFVYSTDTLRGSSGAPAVNDQWQLAALHHAGVPRTDADGRWLKKNGDLFNRDIDKLDAVDWIANEGVRISRIVENMRGRVLNAEQRELFAQAFEPAPMRVLDEGGSQESQEKGNPQMDRDGTVRWTFQVAFGPVGVPATAPSPRPTVPVVPSIVPAVPAGPVESVFEPRGDYYNALGDRNAADDYYRDVADDLSKSDRFDTLNRLLTDTHSTVLSYKRARHDHLYPWIDRRQDQTLKSIYSGDTMPEALFLAEIQAFDAVADLAAKSKGLELAGLADSDIEEIDLALESGSAFNCEHVVPQSWFEKEAAKRAQKSDLHHLFTCESGCNSFRSNIPYSEFTEEEEQRIRGAEVTLAEAILDPTLEAVRPKCGLRDGKRFEPTAGKAAVARATLYFVLRYPGAVGDIKSGKKKELLKSDIPTLLDWAESEPPTQYEKHRNAEIAKVQGNRNPLIDRPEWLRKIRFEKGFG